ncbi:uncharacterized protein PHACADRAFT_260198 [Phanerochaete carnosa HHB-10118-sp]|uniref:Uncharacterized protein n=1 Tax=Phanerochaete carnosa (strain HHB-10118-sp) TaxID=650164 RepID=K5W3K3_PHACS|nr:uncharacterized protein PHACADRAFT_260198 [Phanerochaete carnosa HHB-10118-sp]EKM53710.1 hypothetical protein PHACADRAFT_260198 [Phanerochaete carnosa HHB-10118-sp]
MPIASTDGKILTQRVASRYKVGPLYIFIALLLLYGLMSLVLGMYAAIASSREMIFYGPGGARTHGQTYTEAEHVQLRLKDPLVAVAERFADPARQGLMLERSALQMFREHPNSARLGVFAEETAMEASGAPLGLFRRRAEVERIVL